MVSVSISTEYPSMANADVEKPLIIYVNYYTSTYCEFLCLLCLNPVILILKYLVYNRLIYLNIFSF